MNFSDFNNLNTERLTLSVINAQDVDIIYDLRSNIEVQKYIQREPFEEMVEAEKQVKKVLSLLANQDAIIWIINLKSESKKIGSICFWNFSEDRKTAEIGYDLLPKFYNKGIMSEAIKAVLEFGFETFQFKTIEAYTNKYNKGSMALLEKNNFVLQPDRKDEDYPDNVVFSLERII